MKGKYLYHCLLVFALVAAIWLVELSRKWFWYDQQKLSLVEFSVMKFNSYAGTCLFRSSIHSSFLLFVF